MEILNSLFAGIWSSWFIFRYGLQLLFCCVAFCRSTQCVFISYVFVSVWCFCFL